MIPHLGLSSLRAVRKASTVGFASLPWKLWHTSKQNKPTLSCVHGIRKGANASITFLQWDDYYRL